MVFSMITSAPTSGLDLLVPSSETMPSPSALFCLSKALRSRTLCKRATINWMQRSRLWQRQSKSKGAKLTSTSASVPGDSRRSPRPSCPSDTPAFSGKKGKNRWYLVWRLQLDSQPRSWWRTRTRWTSLFPPLRMEIPSLRVVVTIGPVSPARGTRSERETVANLKPKANLCGNGSVCGIDATFAGADHLQHHLGSATVVKSGLLVQEPLFLHLFFLHRSERHERLLLLELQ